MLPVEAALQVDAKFLKGGATRQRSGLGERSLLSLVDYLAPARGRPGSY